MLNLSEQNCTIGTLVDVSGFQPVLGRGRRVKNTTAMRSAIARLGEDDNGDPTKLTRPRKRAAKPVGTTNKYSNLDVEESSDADDSDFCDETPGLQRTSDSESDSDKDQQMTNEEVF